MTLPGNEVAAEDGFAGVKGRRIRWRSWSPAGDQQPLGVVTIAHGYGEHSGRYEHVAARLTTAGYAVYAPDHHGHGRSEGRRGRIVLADAVADLDQLITGVAIARHPELPQFLLGHSMGGAIALRYAIAHQERLRAMVLSAPLAEVEGAAALKAVGKLLGVVLPSLPVSRVDPALVSRDHAVVDSYVADPLNYHGRISAAVAREFIVHVASLPGDVPAIGLPTLLLWGSADRLCPPRGAEMVAAAIGSSDLTAHALDGLFHEIMNEPERDQVLDEIVAWLDVHLPGAGR